MAEAEVFQVKKIKDKHRVVQADGGQVAIRPDGSLIDGGGYDTAGEAQERATQANGDAVLRAGVVMTVKGRERIEQAAPASDATKDVVLERGEAPSQQPVDRSPARVDDTKVGRNAERTARQTRGRR